MNIDAACPNLTPPFVPPRPSAPVLSGGRELIDAWTRLAFLHREDGRLDEAETAARVALLYNPDTAEARHVLGMVHHDRNRLAEAEDSFRGAIRLNPDSPGAWINLGLVRQKLGDLLEAEACYRVAHRLGAPIAGVGGNLGLVLLEQGRVEEAELACRMSLSQNPGDLGARLNLAMILLLTGRYEEGWDAYEARIDLDPWPVPQPNPAALPLTEILEGRERVVLVRAEQGFGDMLQFCRYIPHLADLGARVVLEVPAPLRRLMRGLRGVDRVITTGEVPPWFDRHCRLMSLPRLFATRLETIPDQVPYLHADATLVEHWRTRLSGLRGRRIGLVWAGGMRMDKPHAASIDRRRSIPFEHLAPLVSVPDCSFVSLRVGDTPRADGVDAPRPDWIETPRAAWLHDVSEGIKDFADTAALIETLDLVIAVDTAVAHLAGGMGKPVWLLNRFDCCWRWLRGRDDSPWYPGLRQFRQTTPGDWDEVIARVVAELRS